MRRLASHPIILLLLTLAAAPFAEAKPIYGPHTVVELGASHETVRPGESVWLAVRFSMDVDWHIYWQNPGDSGIPPRFKWTLPEGVTAGAPHWPTPHRISVPPLMDFGYSGTIYFPVQLSVSPDFPVGRPIDVGLQVSWLVCKEVCIPGKGTIDLRLRSANATARPVVKWQKEVDHVLQTEEPKPLRNEFVVKAEWLGDAFGLRVEDPTKRLKRGQRLDFLPLVAEQVLNAHLPQNSGDLHSQYLEIPAAEGLTDSPERLAGVLAIVEGGETGLDGKVTDAKIIDSFYIAPEVSASSSIALALLFALLGGLILNLMPCVFPVLSIKVMSLVKMNEKSHAGVVAYALSYTAGVVLSFLALAAVLIGLRAAGEQLGWGFQLQSPSFIVFLVFLFFLLSLNLLGWFEIGTALTRAGGMAWLRHHSHLAAFGNGVFAVIVATPCTAPFMGSALGFALSQPPAAALTVFAALGLGMALPFLVLAFVPAGLKLLPRPGAWMETFKQALAFPLLLTGVWLVWVLSLQGGTEVVASVLAGLVTLTFAIWVLKLRSKRRAFLLAVGVPLLIGSLAGPLYTSFQVKPREQATENDWKRYRPADVQAELESGRPVFVDFTAAWCLSCQVNKRVALSTADVKAAFKRKGVVRFRADWTNRDPEITQALQKLGRSGVPVYALYTPGREKPRLLPEVLTPAIVINALDTVAP
jgi:DsbC/DsbD-like thiol-disulfide interchange protein/cytochrome c biogenesis protein CcdA/thiol-disulfide isomerase/thioredoxin